MNTTSVATLPESLMNPQGTTAELVVNIPASQGIGLLPQSDINFYPYGLSFPAVSVVPSTEVWRIEDLGTTSAVNPDVLISIIINGQNQPIAVDLNTAVFSNSGRLNPVSPYIDILPNSTFAFSVYLISTNGATAQTYNVSVKMVRIPLSVYTGTANGTTKSPTSSHMLSL
jgi:hypothetical protein